MNEQQLYTKEVSAKGKVTYKPVQQQPSSIDGNQVIIEMTNAQVCSAVAAIGICCLHAFERHLPEHALVARKIIALEVAIGDVANLAKENLNIKQLEAATEAWYAAIDRFAKEMMKG